MLVNVLVAVPEHPSCQRARAEVPSPVLLAARRQVGCRARSFFSVPMPDAFAPGPSHPSAAPLFAGAALLDAEKLRVYQLGGRVPDARGGACSAAARSTTGHAARPTRPGKRFHRAQRRGGRGPLLAA